MCTGNICRSAMANIVLRYSAEQLGIADRFIFDSGGVSNEEQGNRMDSRAVTILGAHGYDISDPLISRHRAKQVSHSEVANADMLLAMTTRHARGLIDRFGANPDKVFLWRWFEDYTLHQLEDANYMHTQLTGGAYIGEDLADPWYGVMDDFEEALTQLEASAEKILRLTTIL